MTNVTTEKTTTELCKELEEDIKTAIAFWEERQDRKVYETLVAMLAKVQE